MTAINSLPLLVYLGLMVLTSSSSYTRLTASERHQSSSTPLAISVTAQLQKPYSLAFVLKQEGGPPVRIFDAALPWGIRTHRMVIAVAASGTIIPPDLYIDDPVPSIETLSKGATRRGTVDLTKDFPLLADIAKRQDVIVFWSYELKTVDGRTLPRTGGFVLIPKGTA